MGDSAAGARPKTSSRPRQRAVSGATWFPPKRLSFEGASAARHVHAIRRTRPSFEPVNTKVKSDPSQRIRSLLVANRGEIAIRVMRAASELGIAHRRDLFPGGPLRPAPVQGGRELPGGRGQGPIEAYLDIADILRIAREAQRRRDPSRLRLPVREPGLRRRPAPTAGIIFIGPQPETMRVLGNKVAARNAGGGGRRAGDAGHRRRCPRTWTVPAPGRPQDRLPGDAQGQLGRRRPRHARDRERGAAAPSCCRWRGARPRPPSATTRSTSRSWCAARATSRCRCWATSTATWCTCSSATARCSGATRRWSSAPRRVFLSEAAARASCARRRCDRARGRLPQRRHGRVPAGCRHRQVLLHRGQSAHPGRAHGDRDASPASTSSRRRSASPTARASATPDSGVPAQADIRLSGHALQCRITTEDPENNFIPDYGRITAYRSPAGFGVRLDAGTAYTGAVITRSYDSLLVKVTAWAPTPEETIARMHRALWEFRIRGVATNLRFLDQLDHPPALRQRRLHHALHRRDAGAVPVAAQARPRQPHPDLHRRRSSSTATRRRGAARGPAELRAPRRCRRVRCRRRRRARKQQLDELGPAGFAQWMLGAAAGAAHRHHACAMRTSRCWPRACARSTCCAIAPVLREPAAAAVLGRMLGRGDLRCRHALPAGGPVGAAERCCASDAEPAAADAAALGERGRLYQLPGQRGALLRARARPPTASTCSASSTRSTGSRTCAWRSMRCCESGRLCEAAICYTGNLSNPHETQVHARLLREAGARAEGRRHPRARRSRTWPACASRARRLALVKALKDEIGLPVHFHTHDTSGIAAASVLAAVDAGADAVDGAMDAMSGLTSQPNLGSIVEALRYGPRDAGPRRRARCAPISALLGAGAPQLLRLRERHPRRRLRGLRARHARRPVHQPARAGALARHRAMRAGRKSARAYADVNEMFGDIVKVTPTSKVVGDLAILMVSQRH